MLTSIASRIRSLLFLILVVAVLVPRGIIAQTVDDDVAEAGVTMVLANLGDAGEVAEVGLTFYGFARSVPGLLENFQASILDGAEVNSWVVNGFQITKTPTTNGEAMTVVGFYNDNINTNNRAASVPAYVTIITNHFTGARSAPMPVIAIFAVGSSAHISSLEVGSEVQTLGAHALDIPSVTNFTAGSKYFSSKDGVLFNGNETVLIRYPQGLGGNYVVPSSVTNIADNAFYNCTKLSSLVIGSNVVQIGTNAFGNSGLQTVYFGGNPPANNGTAFNGVTNCTVYYLPGFKGWGTTGAPTNFGGLQAQLYNPFLSFPTDGARTINSFSGWHNPASDVVLIPSVIDGLPVKSIAADVFSYQTGVTNVLVPDSVTNIGYHAFDHCVDLKTITLSTNLIGLGNEVFLSCSNLTRLSLPNGVTVIPDGLAAYCTSLTTLIIGKNVTNIGYAACHTCPKLFSLNIPATVTSIGDAAFYYCGNLRVTVDPANPFYSSDLGGALFNKSQTRLIHANSQSMGSYTVPDSVVNIDDTAFYGADISAVFVPAGVMYLGENAFANCANLKGAYFAGNPPTTPTLSSLLAFGGSTNAVVYRLPNTVGWQSTYAGANVQLWIPYDYSTNNASITLNSYSGPGGNVVLPGSINGTSVTAIQAGLIANPAGVESLTLPDSISNIPDGAFSGLVNLTNIVFGNNVTNIGNNAFTGCSSLANLIIPDTVRSIGSGAFSQCGITNVVIGSGLASLSDNLFSGCSLQSLTIPATVVHIGASTFANNPLKYVVIPGSVTSLGANAFANCKFLADVYFQGNAPANDGTSFSGAGSLLYLYNTVVKYLPATTGWGSTFGGVPTEVLPLYYTTNRGTITITQFSGGSSPIGFPIFSSINGVPVTGIADYAFANRQKLTGVMIPAGITNIGAGPFINCTSLTNLVVAAGNPSYVSVSNVLFNSAQTVLKQYAGGLNGTYQVPNSVTTIGAGAFYGSGVKQVTMGAGVTTIGTEAFAFCRGLTSLVVAAGNTSYVSTGGVLFNAARTLLVQYPGGLGGAYSIPSTVTSVGPSAFAGSGVTSLVVSNNVSVITGGAFGYCSRLTNITVLPGNATFASVNGVLENAGQNAVLAYPGGLAGSFTISTNITSIGNLAFAGASLGTVTVPATVSSVGSSAFAGCTGLFAANFFGNAPSNDGTAFTNSFNVVVHRLASGTGWGSQYGGASVQIVPFFIQENGNNTLTVTGYYGTAPSFLAVPDNIFGEMITAIGNHAFDSQTNVSNLSIPSTVTSIGDSAFFGCNRLTSLTLRSSESLNVGPSAFAGCVSLGWVVFGTAPANIGDHAFEACRSLTRVDYGGVTNIGNYAFNACTSYKYVFIGDSVVSIGNYAFANFTYEGLLPSGVTQIVLPASLKSLGSYAFANCGTSATERASVYTYGSPPTSDGTAFAGGYAELFVSPGLGWSTTYNGMPATVIPSSFNYTISGSRATITGLISGYNSLIIPPFVFGNQSVTPVPVVAIGNNAFAGNLNITNVQFPASLENIGDAAFLNCSNLMTAPIPDSVTSIGASAFQNCVKLQGINVSQNVTNLGAYAFAGCPGSTNLVFGAGLTYLGTNAFMGWTNLQSVYFNGDAPNGGSALTGNTNALIYVLPGSSGWGTTYFGTPVAQWTQYYYNLYTNGVPIGQNAISVLYGPDSPALSNTNGSTNVSVILQGYAGSQGVVTVPSVINGWPVTSLSSGVFFNRRDINSVILPNSITDLDGFKYCSLTNIVLSTNLLTIAPSAFYGSALQSVILPDSLTNLADQVFYLSGLTNVILPKNLVSIGDYAFAQCPLQSIALPHSLLTIGNCAFNLAGLTNIVLPPALTTIGDRAFFGCSNSGSILIPPAVSYIGDEAFNSFTYGVSAVYFEGNAPTSDGTPFEGVLSYAFNNGFRYSTGPGIAYYDPSTYGWGATYSGLKTVPWYPYTYTINGSTVTITGYQGSGGDIRVPSAIGGLSVTTIAANAFASNSTLTRITLPATITSVGASAFAGCTNLLAVYFNGNAPEAGANLFAGDNVLVYYLDSTSGWGSTLSGTPVSSYAATGAITVNINPSTIGAKWQVDGGAFYVSGATATNLSVGTHLVSFSTLGGNWQTPNSITLSVGAFAGTVVTIPYGYVPFSYVTNGNGTLTITGYSGSGGVVYIPATINGATVSGIAANAFANSSITSIIIPSSITSVGTNAFANCQNLVSATIGSGITNLSGSVFLNCSNLVSVFFDGNAPTTDGTIFTGDSNTTIYYLTGATGFGSTYSGKIASVIPYTFSVLGDNTIRITGYNGPGGNLTIPSRIGGLPVTDIYSSVFQTNLSLTSVTIPDTVISIEYQAFAGCSNLQSVILGTNVQEIGLFAFINCSSLASINFPDSLRIIYGYAFENDGNLTNIDLGQGLTTIDDAAFQNCTNLSQLTFGNSLTNIGGGGFGGGGAFAFCRALTNLTFPNGLVTIQSGAFASCTNLSSVSFNPNLSFIGNGAFSSCNFTNLVLPANIYLGTNAFAFCRQLETVFFSGMFQFNNSPLVDPFYSDTSAILYYPTAVGLSRGWLSPNVATSDYKAAIAYGIVGSSVSIDHIAGMNGISLVIPDTLLGYPVTSIASNAMSSYINSLTIGSGILTIGSMSDTNFGINTIIVDAANPNYTVSGGVLFDKTQTTLIRFPTSLNAFGNYTVPSSVTAIADYAFQGCQVGSVTLSSNLTSIGNGAFFGATYLANVLNAAPDHLTFLGQSAFQGCAALTNFVTGNNLPSIQPWTFANCTQLKSITLGQSVGSIGMGAFSNCVNLASIALPSGLGSIGAGAFANCQSLTTLVIPAGVPAGTNYYSIQLGSGVFSGCTGLQSVYFLGNRPNPDYGNTFSGDAQLTIHYLTNSLGWSTTFDGTTTASYAPFGTLQVSFTPNLGAAAWQVDGGSWLTNDGTAATLVISNVPAGSHTISFAAVNGFYTPPNQMAVVNNQSLTSISATYVQTPVNYTVNSTNSITITGVLQLNADGFLVVPPTINGVPVTGIGDSAFFNNQSLVGVILPATVTNIGDTAFMNCTNLVHVILDTNLLSIGNSAFSGCKRLQSVQIPDSVTTLGQGAFANCTTLSSAQIGSGITTVVGNSAFNNDPSLFNFFFNGPPPSDVAFLKSSYPQVVSLYYNSAAAGWVGVTNGHPTNWSSLFNYSTNNNGAITITGMRPQYYYPSIIVPPSINGMPVTIIGDNAFQYTSPYCVLLPSTITTIAPNGFNQCNVQSMFVGAAVTNIGVGAFSSVGPLANLFVDPANPNYSDIAGILYNKAKTELIACGVSWGQNKPSPIQLTVPDGVIAVGDRALSGLYYVSQIDLPATLASIGDEGLSGCYNLTNITVDPLNTSFVTENSTLLNASETVLIQYFGRAPKYTIPNSVQFIGSGSFLYNNSLTSVVIPGSVVDIGADCFSGTSLTSLIIPNSVTNIGERAFAYDYSLTSVALPAGLKSISADLLISCESLTNIVIPSGVTNIGDRAFAYSGLTQIIIPDQVTAIGREAFAGCYSLVTATLGASVTNIGVQAFMYDTSLVTINFDNNLVSISSNAFYNCYSLEQLVLPASLASLGTQAFYNTTYGAIYFLGNAPAVDGQVFNRGVIYYYSGTSGWGSTFAGTQAVNYSAQFSYVTNSDGTLTIVGCSLYGDIELPSNEGGHSVTGIASEAFSGLGFENVTIPAGVTNIAPDAFKDCVVANFIVDAGNPAVTSVAGSLYDKTLTTLIAAADKPSFNLPSTATNVVVSLFDTCFHLENISVDAANPLFCSVDGVLFNKQTNVLVHYPPGATAGSYNVPDSVTTIGTNAFMGSSLGAIRVSASVTNVQARAMGFVRSVYFEGAAPQFDPTAFTSSPSAIVFYLPPANAGDFTSTGRPVQEWLSLFNCQTNTTSITIVGYNAPNSQTYVLFPEEGISGLPITDVGTAFAESTLNGITLPDGVTNIADGAFHNSELRQVGLSANVASIGNEAFLGCYLVYVNIPSGVSCIGNDAFAENSLTSLVIPAGVKVLGNGVFRDNELSAVSLTNGLMSIGENAFANNDLGHIYLPNSVTNIGAGAFKDNSLTNAVIAASTSIIQSETFANNSLLSVSFAAGLRSIEDHAFEYNQFTNVVIPAGVTNIGAYAFDGNSLSSLQLSESLVSIGDSAFQYGSLTSLVVPASVTSIGDSAFYGNSITAAYFFGNAPANDNGTALDSNDNPTAYYLSGTTGWVSSYGGAPTQMLSQPASGTTNADNTLTITTYIGQGSVVVPSTVNGVPVQVIGTGAFALGGSSINSITLQSGIVAIAFEAFRDCPNLTTVVIPATVTKIDIDAFAGCPGLTNIFVDPNNPYFSSMNGVLFNKDQTTLLACGGGVTGTYVVPSTVVTIGEDAFMGCSGLTNVVLPIGLACIGDPAFAFCDNLTTVTIPATVTNIGSYSFAYCSRLTSIYFEGNAPPDDGTVFQGDVNATVYYRSSAVGFGPTFGSVPTMSLKAPVASPVTVYRNIGSTLQIATTSLASSWTDPNNAYPVTLQTVGNTSTNHAPVSNNSGLIGYSNTNNVNDRIIYTIVNNKGMVGLGVINIVPVGIGLSSSGFPNVSLQWGGLPVTNSLATAFVDAEFAAGALTYSVVSNSNPYLVSAVVNGSSLTLAPLHNQHGTAQITVRAIDPAAHYADGTFTVTVNGVLLASDISAERIGNNSVSFSISNLLAIASVPFTNDVASLSSFDATTSQGGAVINNSGRLIYYPPSGTNTDSFTYTISDTHGETAVGTITVSFIPDQPMLTVTATMRSLRFIGIAGQHYEIQAAASITGPWLSISGVLTAETNGAIWFDDTETPAPVVRFYRLVALP